jgi:hypothetical protein
LRGLSGFEKDLSLATQALFLVAFSNRASVSALLDVAASLHIACFSFPHSRYRRRSELGTLLDEVLTGLRVANVMCSTSSCIEKRTGRRMAGTDKGCRRGRLVRLLGGEGTLYALAGRGLEVRRGLVEVRWDIEKNKGFFLNLGMEWNGTELLGLKVCWCRI